MRPTLVVALASLAAGCATPQGRFAAAAPERPAPLLDREAWGAAADAPAPAQARPAQAPDHFDPLAFASHQPNNAACAEAAAQLHETDRERGWAALRACVDPGGFAELRALLRGAWDEELRTRPDAPALLAKVIAARGGDVETDLALINKRRIPLFTLGQALNSPDVYRGQLVLMRVQASEIRVQGGAASVLLSEHKHGLRDVYAPVGRQYGYDGHYGSRGPDSSTSANHASERHGRYERRMEDTDVETGREALGRLAKPDPFLVPDRDFIVLARFNGTAPSDESGDDDREADRVALVEVLSYAQPGGLPVY